MDWCGRVGEVRELFRSEWSVGYHWVIPKISSMPDRSGPVYYSPSLKFLGTTWYLGIYRYSGIGDDEWIGFDMRRSTSRNPMPVRFSVGLLQADNSECLLHRYQNFPSRDNVYSINEFLLKSSLVVFKDKFAPSDELTITCVIWPDAPFPGESERKDAVTDGVSLTKFRNRSVGATTKSITISNMPSGNRCTLRKVSGGDEWVVRSLPSKTTPDDSCPVLSCARGKYGDRSLSEPALNSKEFCHSAQPMDSRVEGHSNKKGNDTLVETDRATPSYLSSLWMWAIRRPASVEEGISAMEDESLSLETVPKTIAVSDKSSENGGTFREISRGFEWYIRLPSSKTTWDVLSSEFTCGTMKYYFRMYASQFLPDDIYFGLIVNITSDASFPLPVRYRVAVKRSDLPGLRWIMDGQMTAHEECFQRTQEIRIQRSELESSPISPARFTFVHYVSVGEIDGEKEVSTQTDKTEVSQGTQTEDQAGRIENLEDFEEQLRLCLTLPEEGECVRLIQKKPLDASIAKFLSEVRKDDKKHSIFAA